LSDFTVIGNPRARHQVTHQKALAQGLRAHGLKVAEIASHRRPQTERVATWGWRLGKELRALGHQVLVMERGFLPDRFKWTSLGWNGLNARATVPPVPEDGGERFATHHQPLKPWNEDGKYILIAGQVPGDAALGGRDLFPWYAEKAEELAGLHGLPVRFRHHPLSYRRSVVREVPGAPRIDGTLDEALEGAKLVVTFNSNTGVDALLAGKPATAEDEGSMIWGMTDRQDWANKLAWRQWTIDEISSGVALQHVGLSCG
jgi:hypothetical protein